MKRSDAMKEKFYEDLHALLATAEAVIITAPSSANVYGTPSPADQHLLPPFDAGEGDVDLPSVAELAAAGVCSRPEARSTGRAGNQGDPRCRWLDGSTPRHLPNEAGNSTPTKARSFRVRSIPFSGGITQLYRSRESGKSVTFVFLLNIPGLSSSPVAELYFNLLLYSARKLALCTHNPLTIVPSEMLVSY
ncbi:unnamed protein product [Schistocephalus solidus]|uniref:Uncharacterized protein n=1 Tax=Schistocephalus solidus TaxID=70667 RepID=A0A183T4A6_SCHSO|nr:unnamed protein product [Schistocephalus solidus]